jgi:2',3'-cyclic-nucleotide 2'-phosphodiesterase (5'-nucleotidase family)
MTFDPKQFDPAGVVTHRYQDDGCVMVVSCVFDTVHPGFRKLVDEDPGTRRTIGKWLERSPESSEAIRIASEDLGVDDKPARGGSTNFGNFAADVVRGSAKRHNPGRAVADIGLLNAGSFRLGRAISKGEAVTRQTMCDVFYHPNSILIFQVQGTDVRKIIERSVERRHGGNFLQVSGLEIVVNAGTMQINIVAEDGSLRSLNLSHTYSVATTRYVSRDPKAYAEFFSVGIEVEESIRSAVESELASGDSLFDSKLRWQF